MNTTAAHKIDDQVFCYDRQILPEFDPQMFDLDWHRENGHLTGRATGRGFAHFLRVDGQALVLRPFRRGGLVGKINRDKYLRRGATASRAFREYALLEWMRDKGLPVPRPVAARYAPRGLFYRADLITHYIPNSRPLADALQDAKLSPHIWSGIGAVVRQMHDLGVDHSDLNCRNILLDSDMKVWLIDFDKCERRPKGQWQRQNLARLKRSLEKELANQPALHWQASDWPEFIAGYEAQTT